MVCYLHRFCVELQAAQLLLSLSLMAHVVQVTLAQEPSHSSLDLNEYVKDVVLFLIDVGSKNSDNLARN